MYVDPEQPNCDEFKHPIRGPLDKYIWLKQVPVLEVFQFLSSVQSNYGYNDDDHNYPYRPKYDIVWEEFISHNNSCWQQSYGN